MCLSGTPAITNCETYNYPTNAPSLRHKSLKGKRVIQTSMVYGKYDKSIDRESAYEILTEKLQKEQEAKELAAQQKEEEKLRKEEEKRQAAEERKQAAEERKRKAEERERLRAKEKSLQKMVVTKAKREAVNAAFKFGRVLLGSLLKG